MVLAGGFTEWVYWAMREAAIQTGLGHLQIARPGFRDYGYADPSRFALPPASPALAAIRSTPGVKAVDERLYFTGLASFGETTIAFAGLGVEPGADLIVSPVLPVSGPRLDRADPKGVLLGRGLATALGARQGDTVGFLVTVPGGGLSAVEAKVRGTFTTEVKAYDDSAVRFPISLARELLRVDGSHVWVAALDSTDNYRVAADDLRSKLPADLEVATWFDLSDFYRKAVTLLSRQIDVMKILIGVIIVLGISNTLAMNVAERTSEIGTLMAMGTTRKSVLRLFLLEGFLLGTVGAIAGAVLGILAAQLISFIGIPMPPPPGRDTGYSARILLTPALVLTSVVIAIVATTIAGVFPAYKAARLPVVDALRHNA